jgi:2-haloacid dehalogenase
MQEIIMQYRAVVFDAYGTLFDVYSVQHLAEQLFPGQGTALALAWRDKQIEYTRLITQSDPNPAKGSRFYQSFWDLTRLSLHYCLDRLQLDRTQGQDEALMGQYAKLRPFPENLEVLRTIKRHGLTTAILSNGSPQMLESAVHSAGMVGLLDHVISVDGIRLFKTAPQAYALVQQSIALPLEEILFVSSNAWDALGANWFGLRTHWVNRQGLPFEALEPRPDYSGSDLSSVLKTLQLKD